MPSTFSAFTMPLPWTSVPIHQLLTSQRNHLRSTLPLRSSRQSCTSSAFRFALSRATTDLPRPKSSSTLATTSLHYHATKMSPLTPSTRPLSRLWIFSPPWLCPWDSRTASQSWSPPAPLARLQTAPSRPCVPSTTLCPLCNQNCTKMLSFTCLQTPTMHSTMRLPPAPSTYTSTSDVSLCQITIAETKTLQRDFATA